MQGDIPENLASDFANVPKPARYASFPRRRSRAKPAVERRLPRMRPGPGRFDVVKFDDHVEVYE